MTPVSRSDPDDASGLAGLGGASALRIGGAGWKAFMSLLLVVVVTSRTGQADAGVFFAATALFICIALIAQVGAQEAVVRLIPAFRATGRSGDVPAVLRQAFRSAVPASIVGAFLTFALAPVLGDLVSDTPDSPDFAALVRVLAAFIPFVTVTEVAVAGARGFQTMRPTVLIGDITVPTLQVALVLVADVVAPDRLPPLVMAYALPYIVGAIWAVRSLRRLAGQDADETAPQTNSVPGYWRFTWPRAVARISQYAFHRVDIVLVAALSGPSDAAVYAVASRFVSVGAIWIQAVQQAAQPKLSELLELGDGGQARNVFRAATAWILIGSVPVYVVIGIYADGLLDALGRGYGAGAAALLVMCGAYLFSALTGPVDIALVMSGRSGTSLVNQLVALVILAAGCVALVPRIGVTGAALAKGTAVVVINVVAAVQVRHRIELNPFSPGVLAVFGGGVGLAVIAILIRATMGPTKIGLVASVVVGGIAYGGCLLWRRAVLDLGSLVPAGLRRT